MLPLENDSGGRIVVFGVGNRYRCDDAIGLIVSQKLRNKNLQQLTAIEQDGDGLSLISQWTIKDKIIIVDAVSSNSVPGSVFHFDLLKQKVPKDKFHFSTHTISLADAVQLATQLKILPLELRLFAIEGKLFNTGIEVTSEVLKSSDMVVNEIIELYNKWIE